MLSVSPRSQDPVAAGIVSDSGLEEVSVNGILYAGQPYTLIPEAFADNSVVAAQGITLSAKYLVGSGNQTLAATECTFSELSSTNGGALGNCGTMILEKSTLSGNTSENSVGGAIYNDASANNTGRLTIIDTVFSNNTADNGGGAIRNKGIVTITGSQFTGNQSNSGGAIANNGLDVTSVTISDTSFIDNVATTGSGGAITNSATLIIGDTVFSGNQSGSGGAIANTAAGTCTINGLITLATESDTIVNSGTMAIDGSAFFKENEVGVRQVVDAASTNWFSGNAITVTEGYTTFTDGSGLFVANGVTSAGIVSDNGLHEVTVNGVVYGGPAYSNIKDAFAAQNVVAVSGITFSEKYSMAFSDKCLAVTGATFSGLSSTNGGALDNGGIIILEKSTMSDNTSVNSVGGAIYNDANTSNTGVITIIDTMFSGNSSDNGGGAIRNKGIITITGSVFTGNQSNSAGAISNGGLEMTSLTISDTEFIGNVATTGTGGAINNSAVLVIGDAVFNGNLAASGGAISNAAAGVCTINGLITLVTESDTIINSGTMIIDGSAFFEEGGAGVRQVVKAATSNWFSGNAVTVTEGYFSFLDGNGLYVAGGATQAAIVSDSLLHEVTVNGVIYAGISYDSIEKAVAANNIVAVSGMTLTDKYSVNSAARTLALYDCTISGITQYGNGGALSADGTLILDNVKLIDNVSSSVGGAIYINGTADSQVSVTVVDSVFSNNFAGGAGGAIRNKGILSVSGSFFSGNQATVSSPDGGAISSVGYDYTNVTIENTIFSNNSSERNGGAVAVGGGSFTLNTVKFYNNQSTAASGTAGALYLLGTGAVTDALFVGNSAIGNGGATTIGNSGIVVTGNRFLYNTAASAGAIFANSKAGGAIGHSEFIGNSSVSNGGGAVNTGGSLTISDSLFSGNYTGDTGNYSGGAINNSGSLSIASSVLSGNSAFYAGGAVANSKTLTVSDSEFSGNSAQYGGAIYLSGNGTAEISNTVFTGNTATVQGGGFYIQGTSGATLRNVIFDGNSASGNNGGAIFNIGTLSLENTEFRTASDTIKNNGSITITGYLKLGATLSTASGSVNADGATIIFDISKFGTANSDALIDVYSNISGGVVYQLEAAGSQADGKYLLFNDASIFTGSIGIDVTGNKVSLARNESYTNYFHGKNYSLSLDNNQLTFTVGAATETLAEQAALTTVTLNTSDQGAKWGDAAMAGATGFITAGAGMSGAGNLYLEIDTAVTASGAYIVGGEFDGTTNLKLTNGTVGALLGGADGGTAQNVNLLAGGGRAASASLIYGAGRGSVTGDVNVEVTAGANIGTLTGGAVLLSNASGGLSVGGDISVSVTGGTVTGNVIGGHRVNVGAATGTASVAGSITIEITGGLLKAGQSVYGGGFAVGNGSAQGHNAIEVAGGVNIVWDGGALTETAGAARVLAEAEKDGIRRVVATIRTDAGGRRIFVRSLPPLLKLSEIDGNPTLHPRKPFRGDGATVCPTGRLLRWSLAELGWILRARLVLPESPPPRLVIARHDGAFYFNGYTPDTTAELEIATPLGVPVPVGREIRLKHGVGVFRLEKAPHFRSRALIRQEEDAVVSTKTAFCGTPDARGRMDLRGLRDAEVRFFVPADAGEVVIKRRDSGPSAYFSDETLPVEWENSRFGRCLIVRHASGTLHFKW